MILTSLAALALLASPATPTYTLDLGRPIRAFDEYTQRSQHQLSVLTVTGKDTMLVHQSVVAIDAKTSVSNVTEDGQEANKVLTINSFMVYGMGDTINLMPGGTSVRAIFSDSGTRYTVNAEAVADSIVPFLDRVVKSEGGEKTGDIMDAHKPVRPGDTWPMNAKALQKSLPELRKVKNFKSSVVFEKVDTTMETPSAIVSGTMTFSTPTVLEGVKNATVNIKSVISVIVPLDNKRPAIARGSEEVITSSGTGQRGTRVSQILHSTLRSSFHR